MKNWKQNIIVPVILQILLIVLLVVSNFIPHKWIAEHIVQSTEQLSEEGLYYVPLHINNDAIKWDNWTTSISLNILWNAGEDTSFSNVVKNAWGAPDEGETVIDSLKGQVFDEKAPNTNYSRYWCGSLIILRFLLQFFDLDKIRLLLMMTMFIIWGIDAYMLYKRFSLRDAIVFSLTFIVTGSFINVMCPTYSQDILLTLIAVLIACLLFTSEENCKKYQFCYFFCLGQLTMFFTWLSYPVVILGIPLIVFLRSTQREKLHLKDLICSYVQMLKLSVFWCLGYAFSMIIKSLLCVISKMEATAGGRIVLLMGEFSVGERFQIIHDRSNAFFNDNIKMLFIIAILLIVVVNIITKRKIEWNNLKKVLRVAPVALYPYVWQFVFALHAKAHGADGQMYMITIMAVLYMINSLWEEGSSWQRISNDIE